MYQLRGIQRMWVGLRWFVTGVAVLSVLVSGVATGQGLRDIAPFEPHAEGEFAPAPSSVRSQPQRRLPQSRLPAQVVLDPVTAASLKMEATAQPAKPGVPLKIGFSRDMPMLRTGTQTSALMVWSFVPGGQLAAISITSPDALGVRLGLLVENLPTTALLRFYAQNNADQVFEVSGQEIMENIARNLAAGDKSDEARTYWSPVIEGQEITVEIDLPAGVSPDEVMFSIPRVSHLFSSPLNTRALQEKIGQSMSCNLDSQCYLSTWGNESLATAKMTFMSGGSSYICTGTLLNDSIPSTYIPFFLTANHCISTQTEASSLQTYWFYRAASCNSGSSNPSTQSLTGGATLLYNSSTTDTSFLRLNSAPPAGAWFSGWTPNLPANYTSVTGIHNPSGDLQKISFGTITDYNYCPPSVGGSFSCTSAASGSADHLKVVWNQGVTEGGSSGSGLWVASGSSHYLVGQLHGGSSSCSSPTASDKYGRFDVAYNTALYQWLGQGAASSCTYSLSSSSQAVSSSAVIGNVTVTASSSCTWIAVSNASWITVTSGASGSGSGSVGYSIAANTGTSARTGSLTIAGNTFTLTQSGSSSTPAPSWTALSGTSPARPSLALNVWTGRTQMVVRSASDQLWVGNFTAGGTFEGWNPLSGTSPSPVAQAWLPGVNKMYMVARAANDQLYLGAFNASGIFEGWGALPGTSPSQVALAWHPTLNKMYMVARAANGQLYLGTFNSAGSFEAWNALPGASPSPVALAWHPTLNKMYMVARAANDQLYLGTFNSAGSFEGWNALSGASPSPVALAWHPTLNKMYMVVRAASNQLWQGTFSSTNGAFEGFSALSGTSPSAPVLAAGLSNLQLVVRSANNQLWSMLLQ